MVFSPQPSQIQVRELEKAATEREKRFQTELLVRNVNLEYTGTSRSPAVKAEIEKQAEGVSGRCPGKAHGWPVSREKVLSLVRHQDMRVGARETRSHLPDDRDEKGTASVSEDTENLDPTQSPGGL